MSEEMNVGKYVPAKTAAKLLRVSRSRVYKLVEMGRLRKYDIDGVLLISVKSINEYDNARNAGKVS